MGERASGRTEAGNAIDEMNTRLGGVAERLKAPVLKSVRFPQAAKIAN
jgi:hypothetical protein